jgi:hypothetical protein
MGVIIGPDMDAFPKQWIGTTAACVLGFGGDWLAGSQPLPHFLSTKVSKWSLS